MKPNAQSSSRYADLLDETSDPELARLVSTLDAAYRAAEPPAPMRAAIGQALRQHAARAQAQRRVRQRPWWPHVRMPRRAVTVTASIVLAALILGGGAFAVEPYLSSLFNFEPGTQQVLDLKLAEQVNVSQRVGGFTVTVDKAYADANNVIVAYTVKMPAHGGYTSAMLVNPVLNTDQGTLEPGGKGYGAPNQGTSQANLLFFDASSITGTPSQLQVHLSADGLMAQASGGKPDAHQVNVPGALAFDFTLAFHPGRVATPHQSVTVHGQTVTLERVVVTVSETRVYLSGISPDWAIGTLEVDGWTSDPDRNPSGGPIGAGLTANGQTVISYGDALFDKHGTWTLTVFYAHNAQAPQGGPWVFHFDVP
jgi:hypothetical protein